MVDLKLYEIESKVVERPWGNEISFNARNTITGRVWQEVIACGKEPSEKEINQAISDKLDWLENSLIETPTLAGVQEITKEQVEQYLKDEGVLLESETLESLKTVLIDVKKALEISSEKLEG
jgi:hypothetical protein